MPSSPSLCVDLRDHVSCSDELVHHVAHEERVVFLDGVHQVLLGQDDQVDDFIVRPGAQHAALVPERHAGVDERTGRHEAPGARVIVVIVGVGYFLVVRLRVDVAGVLE